ncbi:MAG: hypothetical protein LBN07_04700 [Christensenellaceae bacterium]|jgi:hypothetical protein|nr:hypothetical protein [Christensenellaceae bacterium]
MSRKKMIAISIVGVVTAILVVTTIILAIIPSSAHALVKNDGLLSKPTKIITYRHIDNLPVTKEYTNDAGDSDTMKKRYNDILDKINNQTGMSVLSGLFAQNKSSQPKVEDIDVPNQYWNGVNKSATAEKIIVVLYYHEEQMIMNGTKEVKFTRAYFTVNDTLSTQTLKIYLFNGTNSTATTMITYNGQFNDLFDYVVGLPTGASTV